MLVSSSRVRGDSFDTSRSLRNSSFSSLDTFVGTSTRTFARRSPRPPFFGTPRPLTRNVLPLGVPAGTFSVTGPFSVGTSTSAPSAASG